MAPIVAGVPSIPRILIDAAEYSATHRAYTLTASVAHQDVTAFGALGRQTQPGLLEGSLTLEAFYKSGGAGPADFVERLEAALQAAGTLVVTVAPEGLVVGRLAQLLAARAVRLGLPARAGEVLMAPVELVAQSNGLARGVSLHDLSAESVSGNGASVDAGAATTTGLIGHLHVTAVTGAPTSVVVKIQHSPDAAVWTDLINFTAFTAPTAQRLSVSGTVNRHRRTTWTFTGGTAPTATFAAAGAPLTR